VSDRLTDLPSPVLAALLPHLDALRHDLGKYVCFQARGLPAQSEAELATLREALRADLLATKRSPQGSWDVLALWGSLAPPLRGEHELEGGLRADLRGDESFDALEAAMAELGAAATALRQGRLADPELAPAAATAREVASRCAELWTRARAAGRGEARGE
jgi:hypothetical protein